MTVAAPVVPAPMMAVMPVVPAMTILHLLDGTAALRNAGCDSGGWRSQYGSVGRCRHGPGSEGCKRQSRYGQTKCHCCILHMSPLKRTT